MNKIINLIIAGIVGASSIVGVNAVSPQQPEVRTEYVYIEADPETVVETETIVEYVYVDATEEQLEEAFNDGYRQGASDGYGDGYAAGYHDCMDDLK